MGLDNRGPDPAVRRLRARDQHLHLRRLHPLHPRELEEAAAMDGASTWGIFWKVIFPLLAPMNATVGILTCLWAWNDFLLPLVILSDPGRPPCR